jgi:hypothetical protein
MPSYPAESMNRRERRRKKALQLTLLSGIVPAATCLLFCVDAMCPGPHGEALEAIGAIAIFVFFPAAFVMLAYALLLLAFAFDARILGTQIAVACSMASPFVRLFG